MGYCRKCGKFGFVHKHHVLPNHFSDRKVTYKLCPNCHTEYHEENKKIFNSEDPVRHKTAFYKWLTVGVIVFVILKWFI